jgi:hypothetical protein
MDIVYLVKTDPENNSEELRYSLRSLSNLPHDRVFIIGEKPAWVTNVEYIPIPQTGTKVQNVSANLFAAIKNDDISDNFILMNDDFFIMKPMDELLDYDFGPLKDVIDAYKIRYPDESDYIKRKIMMYNHLLGAGYQDPLSYELHVPMRIDKHETRRIIRDAKGARLYQFRTYYGNYAGIKSTTIKDVKIFLDPTHNDPDYNADPQGYMESQQFLSATGGSFKRGLPGDFIRQAIPKKSVYELD